IPYPHDDDIFLGKGCFIRKTFFTPTYGPAYVTGVLYGIADECRYFFNRRIIKCIAGDHEIYGRSYIGHGHPSNEGRHIRRTGSLCGTRRFKETKEPFRKLSDSGIVRRRGLGYRTCHIACRV
ncbi:MAG: hypothetical protein OXF02_00210, partial [Simkaniaceae bacterium]|nr:hypothetical protein [Simkaniaceae bacterium]